MSTYKLELNEVQLNVIKVALEDYFRTRMGQFWDFTDEVALAGWEYNKDDPKNDQKFDDFIHRRDAAKGGMNMRDNKTAVSFDGVCPVCGSIDGMIIYGKDGKYRTMCRVMGCPAWYKPCPVIGFDTEEDCRNPFDSKYLKDGMVSVEEYVSGKIMEE